MYGKHLVTQAPKSENTAADCLCKLLMRQCEWVVDAKRPFAGPAAVLAYLSCCTHRVAIANSRLIALDERGVSFHFENYRAKGRSRYKTMTLSADEFIRRFLLHVLRAGFHRIRHRGLIANTGRTNNPAPARELLIEATAVTDDSAIPTSESRQGPLGSVLPLHVRLLLCAMGDLTP